MGALTWVCEILDVHDYVDSSLKKSRPSRNSGKLPPFRLRGSNSDSYRH
jgi:hypothetical protein